MNQWAGASREQLMDAAAGLLEVTYPEEFLDYLGVDGPARRRVADLIAELRSRGTTPADPAQIGLDL